MKTVTQVPVAEVHPNPKQPRKTFKQETIIELAQSIQENDLLQPIIVEADPAGGYILIAGERRLRATQYLKRKKIDAIVRPSQDLNDQKRLLNGIIENVQREDMNVIDEGEAYEALRTVHQMSDAAISKQVGKSVTHIQNCLRRLELPADVQEMMRDGQITHDMRVVSVLLQIKDDKSQVELCKRVRQNKMSIQGILAAATRIAAALAAEPLEPGEAPSLHFAGKRSKVKVDMKTPPANWGALQQLGSLPPWKAVVGCAQETCGKCELRDIASKEICGKCPVVELLAGMVRVAA